MKGFLSFLIVFGFVITITLAVSSYIAARESENWKPIVVDSVYYKMQDIKHAHFIAVKKGVEEGVAIYNAKWTGCYVGCIIEKCAALGPGCIADLLSSGSAICRRKCKNDMGKIEDTVKDWVNNELNSLTEDVFSEGGRYLIDRWCACLSDSQMDTRASNIRRGSRYGWATDFKDCITMDVADITTGEIRIDFESVSGCSGHYALGFAVLDTYSNVSLIGYIPQTESFKVCCAVSEMGDITIEDIDEAIDVIP